MQAKCQMFSKMLLSVSILAFVCCPQLCLAKSSRTDSYPAVIEPWRSVTLAFSRPGIVAAAPVRLGARVKAGQLLACENAFKQELLMRIAELAAESTLRVQASQAQLRHDQVDYKRTQWAYKEKAATEFELQRAGLKVTIDQLSLSLAELKHHDDQLQYRLAQLAVRRREIRAPFAGIVETRFAHAGQSVNAFEKVIQLVRINPLKVRVPVPILAAMHLKLGQPAIIRFSGSAPMIGKIVLIASVADSASGTLLVRVKVPNPSELPAGRQVEVSFSSRLALSAQTPQYAQSSAMAGAAASAHDHGDTR